MRVQSEHLIIPSFASRIPGRILPEVPGKPFDLLGAERTTLKLFSLGKTATEIASEMDVSLEEVREMSDTLCWRYTAHNLAVAINRAIIKKDLEIDPDRESAPYLKPKQRKLLSLVASGHGNQSIANHLNTKSFIIPRAKLVLLETIGAKTAEHGVRLGHELGFLG